MELIEAYLLITNTPTIFYSPLEFQNQYNFCTQGWEFSPNDPARGGVYRFCDVAWLMVLMVS